MIDDEDEINLAYDPVAANPNTPSEIVESIEKDG